MYDLRRPVCLVWMNEAMKAWAGYLKSLHSRVLDTWSECFQSSYMMFHWPSIMYQRITVVYPRWMKRSLRYVCNGSLRGPIFGGIRVGHQSLSAEGANTVH